MSGKVKALTSFVGHYGADRKTMVVSAGDEFELPDGVDWVTCGFCEPVEAVVKPVPRKQKVSTASRKPSEKGTRK